MGKGEGSGEGWGEGEGQGYGEGMGAAEWKHGLFGCMSDGGNCKLFSKLSLKPVNHYILQIIISFTQSQFIFFVLGLCGWCCGPCLLCQNANKMGESPVLYCLLSCITPCIPLFLLRQKLRERNGIDGETSHDAVASCCCACCVNIQIANELDH